MMVGKGKMAGIDVTTILETEDSNPRTADE